MPWKECERVSQRLEFCRFASLDGSNMMTLCRNGPKGASHKADPSPFAPTRARWFAIEGELSNRSRRPGAARGSQTLCSSGAPGEFGRI